MGKPYWDRFIKPYLKVLYDRVKASGKYISQHSCGDLRDIMNDLYELGLDIYQTFQPEIYGLDYAKELHGKITVWGGISTQVDLPFRSVDELRVIVQKTVEAFQNTGLILSPTHAIEVDVPQQNIAVLAEEFLAYENYDLK